MSDDLSLIVGGRRGRPPRAGSPATERVAFRLTKDERAALETVAKAERGGITAVIRAAVNEFVADYGERVVFLPSGDRFRRR